MGHAKVDVAAVAFDLYGTLLDVRSLEERCREAVPDAPAAELVSLWRQKQLEYTWLRSLMGRYVDFWAVTGDALDHALARLRIGVDGAGRERLLDGWLSLRPQPEVQAALEMLEPRPLAVLSNGSPGMLDDVLRRTGLRDRFAHVISADEAGTYKPSPAVYALAGRHLRLRADRILFVSANGWDVAGAAAFGLVVAWVDRSGHPAEVLPGAPALVVPDLLALASRIEQWVLDAPETMHEGTTTD